MKATIEQLEFLIKEMARLQREHPKATIYYDWEEKEIRITYPLPQDFGKFEITRSDIEKRHGIIK